RRHCRTRAAPDEPPLGGRYLWYLPLRSKRYLVPTSSEHGSFFPQNLSVLLARRTALIVAKSEPGPARERRRLPDAYRRRPARARCSQESRRTAADLASVARQDQAAVVRLRACVEDAAVAGASQRYEVRCLSIRFEHVRPDGDGGLLQT